MSSPGLGFTALGVPPDLTAVLDAVGIVNPTTVQTLVIPDALAGRDVSGRAPTRYESTGHPEESTRQLGS